MSPDPTKYNVLLVEDEPDVGGFQKELERLVTSVLGAFDFHGQAYQPQLTCDVVGSKNEAVARLDAIANTPALAERGYDLVLVDLDIFETADRTTHDVKYGFDVLEALGRFDWPTAVIVLSRWAADSDTVALREAHTRRLTFHEWLPKQDLFINEARYTSKLSRWLVPLHWYAEMLESMEGPIVCRGRATLRALRTLVVEARASVMSWPLSTILLLGDAGSGKGVLAKAFYELLPEVQDRRPRIDVNCASLVTEGHGGLIRLFGRENWGGGLPSRPGAFEHATFYSSGVDTDDLAKRKQNMEKKAGKEYEIDYKKAGVVFLDEFVTLKPDLQAALLNAMQDGQIYREGSYARVDIGCHIVCATNATPEDIMASERASPGEHALRRDLLDRISCVVKVPSLAARPPTEIERLVTIAAEERLKAMNMPSPVCISESALAVIRTAVQHRVINSVRQLRVVGKVFAHENEITDGNLASVFEKAAILGIGRSVAVSPEELCTAEIARRLGLDFDLHTDEVAEKTLWAMRLLYRRAIGAERTMPVNEATAEPELRRRLIILSKFVPAELKAKIYTEGRTDLANRIRRHIEAIEGEIGTKCPSKRNEKDAWLIAYLRGRPVASA